MAKNRKLEKSMPHFDGHQNPTNRPENRMKSYLYSETYDLKPISTSKTICVMKKKEVSYPSKISIKNFENFTFIQSHQNLTKRPVNSS